MDVTGGGVGARADRGGGGGLLLMCKLWRITHKLSIAQKGL